MANRVEFTFGTDEQIQALTPSDPLWIELGFYYPADKTWFYQIVGGVLRKYGGGETSEIGVGATINDKVIGAIKTRILNDEVLKVPENYDYNTFFLDMEGSASIEGNINIM